MTAADLTALLNADLTDAANRLVLADALEDCDRSVEAAILRSGLPVEAATVSYRDGAQVLPDLAGENPASNDDNGGLIGRERAGWVNCTWGTISVGGCWVYSASTAAEENARRNYHPSHPHRIEAGDVEPYQGNDMNCLVEAMDAIGVDALCDPDAVGVSGELADLIQAASRRECRRVMEEYLAEREQDEEADDAE